MHDIIIQFQLDLHVCNKAASKCLLLSSWVMELRKGSCAWFASCLESRRSSNFSLDSFTGFFECKHPFINKPIQVTYNWACYTRHKSIRPGSKLYPSNVQRMLHKNLTQFMQSLSRVHQNQVVSKRKALLAGGQLYSHVDYLLWLKKKMRIQQSSYQSLILLWFVATQLWCCSPLAW